MGNLILCACAVHVGESGDELGFYTFFCQEIFTCRLHAFFAVKRTVKFSVWSTLLMNKVW